MKGVESTYVVTKPDRSGHERSEVKRIAGQQNPQRTDRAKRPFPKNERQTVREQQYK